MSISVIEIFFFGVCRILEFHTNTHLGNSWGVMFECLSVCAACKARGSDLRVHFKVSLCYLNCTLCGLNENFFEFCMVDANLCFDSGMS